MAALRRGAGGHGPSRPPPFKERAIASRSSSLTDEQFDFDAVPVVKLFTPDAGGTWLLVQIDPEDYAMAWDLCDPGVGCPEIGPVSLDELAGVHGMMRLPIEQDLHFRADKRLSGYAGIVKAKPPVAPDAQPAWHISQILRRNSNTMSGISSMNPSATR